MDKLIAICGLNCKECEAYIATQNNDMRQKEEIAKKWSGLYSVSVSPEDINCVGCGIDGDHIGYCSICEVRKCGISNSIENCALCDSYPDCNTLNKFLKMAPEDGRKKIKDNLEKIKAKINHFIT